MSIDPLTAIFDIGKTAIERIWPDANKRAEELRKLEELRQGGDLARLDAHVKLMLAQIKVNEEQARSKSFWVAGARPAAIWAGVFSLSWSGIFHPLLTWVWAFSEMPGEPPPVIESGVLGSITMGLLGVAGMRSFDKTKGTQTDAL